MFNQATPKIAIIGLGYVGLPLSIAFAKYFKATGFDINQERITELKSAYDRTAEITQDILKQSTLKLTYELEDIKDHDIYIITVPTPVTKDNLPDLLPLQKASETVAKVIKKNAIVVFESTVYPGVTEEFCGPIIEKFSGLKAGQDFFLGYSPERINPGDSQHTIDKITKVVAGQTPDVTEILKHIYGSLNNHNIFAAKNIKTAEAAKVIENTQRDINIAFINEITTIMHKLDLSIYDVLEAAGTKWNFLKFQPGLVGGHCIGVDPYYLAHCARELDQEPEVILAGRRINENMGRFIANAIHQRLQKQCLQNKKNKQNKQPKQETFAKILVLGLTFKENIPDLRNTKVIDLVNQLKQYNHQVDVHDCFADSVEAKNLFGIELLKDLNNSDNVDSIDNQPAYDCIIAAVPHKPYLNWSLQDFKKHLQPNGVVADIKKIWNTLSFPKEIDYWTL